MGRGGQRVPPHTHTHSTCPPSKPHELVHLEAAAAAGVQLIRRFTGGGTGEGVLLLARVRGGRPLPADTPSSPSPLPSPPPPSPVVVDGDTVFTALIMGQAALPGVDPYPRPLMQVGWLGGWVGWFGGWGGGRAGTAACPPTSTPRARARSGQRGFTAECFRRMARSGCERTVSAGGGWVARGGGEEGPSKSPPLSPLTPCQTIALASASLGATRRRSPGGGARGGGCSSAKVAGEGGAHALTPSHTLSPPPTPPAPPLPPFEGAPLADSCAPVWPKADVWYSYNETAHQGYRNTQTRESARAA